MPRLFALADLHLSLSGDKPMDRFGELWRDHATRMAEAWDADVAAADTVLLPGDLSWGRNLEEARPDLDWIGARPGRKVLLRGNHDSWWGSRAKLAAALPASCSALQNDSTTFGDWVIVGARGWLAPDDPLAGPHDADVFRRELERLRLSLADADRRHGKQRPRLAMLHFPPWLEGRAPTAVVALLRQAGVSACVYGHLHGDDHRLAVRGERDGIRYWFVAADAVGFRPVELEL
ncbi:MAG TPA: metallophosphoesterase [Candidatus Polarisedimenticolaceae bacterium]|nr:metallophosphoesterase [Candidatus Polarisedimenticolaceae bacterium]